MLNNLDGFWHWQSAKMWFMVVQSREQNQTNYAWWSWRILIGSVWLDEIQELQEFLIFVLISQFVSIVANILLFLRSNNKTCCQSWGQNMRNRSCCFQGCMQYSILLSSVVQILSACHSSCAISEELLPLAFCCRTIGTSFKNFEGRDLVHLAKKGQYHIYSFWPPTKVVRTMRKRVLVHIHVLKWFINA